MLATAFFAASSRSLALWIGSPESLRICFAASTLVPVITFVEILIMMKNYFINFTFKSNDKWNFQLDAFTSTDNSWCDGCTVDNTSEHVYKNSFDIFVCITKTYIYNLMCKKNLNFLYQRWGFGMLEGLAVLEQFLRHQENLQEKLHRVG